MDSPEFTMDSPLKNGHVRGFCPCLGAVGHFSSNVAQGSGHVIQRHLQRWNGKVFMNFNNPTISVQNKGFNKCVHIYIYYIYYIYIYIIYIYKHLKYHFWDDTWWCLFSKKSSQKSSQASGCHCWTSQKPRISSHERDIHSKIRCRWLALVCRTYPPWHDFLTPLDLFQNTSLFLPRGT